MKIATGTVAAGKITGSFSFGNGAQWLADRRMLAANLRPTKRVEETLQRYYLRTTRQAGGFVIVPTWFLPNDRASIITESLTRSENRQFKWSPIKAFSKIRKFQQRRDRAAIVVDCYIAFAFLYHSSFSGHCRLGK